MLYLSQRKISQITGMNVSREGQDGPPQPPPPAPAERRQPGPELSPPSAWQPPAQLPAGRQPAGGWQPSSAWGEGELNHSREHIHTQPMRTVAGTSYQERQAGNQAYVDSGPDGSPTQQQQSNQPQIAQSANVINVNVNVDEEGKKYLNSEISKTNDEINENKKSLKSRLIIAAFLGFCSICIGIGANMKYGVGEMSAFESLAGKHGAGGTAANLWNSGSTTDSLRGINYGFAIFGFTLPIVGTIFSLIGAFINFNQINKGKKNNKLREIAKTGFSLPKTVNPDIHPNNHEKIQTKINELSSGAPDSKVAPEMAVQLARVHQKESRAL